MTALWIGLAVIVVALLIWRLRRAAKVLDRIVSEELGAPDPLPDPLPDPSLDAGVHEAESRNP